MKNFIKIFERDPFGDKATDIIKAECDQKTKEILQKAVANAIRL